MPTIAGQAAMAVRIPRTMILTYRLWAWLCFATLFYHGWEDTGLFAIPLDDDGTRHMFGRFIRLAPKRVTAGFWFKFYPLTLEYLIIFSNKAELVQEKSDEFSLPACVDLMNTGFLWQASRSGRCGRLIRDHL